MGLIITTEERGSQVSRHGFQLPEGLFKGIGSDMHRAAARVYVEREMVQMAEEQRLSVTYLHNCGDMVSMLAGMIILGLGWDETATPYPVMVRGMDVPEALEDYRVMIRGRVAEKDYSFTGGKPDRRPLAGKHVKDGRHVIRWKKGREPMGAIIGPDRDMSEITPQARWEDVWVTTDVTEGELRLRDAWKVLHQYGAHCTYAPKLTRRDSKWRYDELRPAGIPKEDWFGEDRPAKGRKSKEEAA